MNKVLVGVSLCVILKIMKVLNVQLIKLRLMNFFTELKLNYILVIYRHHFKVINQEKWKETME
jgi:hypothetical protein